MFEITRRHGRMFGSVTYSKRSATRAFRFRPPARSGGAACRRRRTRGRPAVSAPSRGRPRRPGCAYAVRNSRRHRRFVDHAEQQRYSGRPVVIRRVVMPSRCGRRRARVVVEPRKRADRRRATVAACRRSSARASRSVPSTGYRSAMNGARRSIVWRLTLLALLVARQIVAGSPRRADHGRSKRVARSLRARGSRRDRGNAPWSANCLRNRAVSNVRVRLAMA